MNEATALFVSKLDTPEGKTKVAQLGESYIRDRLREVAYSRKVNPIQPITPAECQRSVNHDTLVKIVDIEPKSRAMTINFRAQPTANYIRGARAEIPFWTISSERYEKTEQELLAYEMPITKVIEDNMVKDIQEIEDRTWTIYWEAACQAIQLEANGGTFTTGHTAANQAAGTSIVGSVTKGEGAIANSGTDNFLVWPITRGDFVELAKLLAANRLRPWIILISEPDFLDILQITTDSWGDRIASETMVDGYKFTTILGFNFIRTIKTDILRPGNVYIFAEPSFHGRFYLLNNTKFYIDKEANQISMQAWEDVGGGVVNIAAIRKLELYTGSITAGFVTVPGAGPLAASVQPVDEEDLGQQNVREGNYVPKVYQY